MRAPRSLEFVENREPQGCFAADVQALTGVNQDSINAALAAAGLYDPEMGVAVTSDLALDAAMLEADIPVRFEEVLPHFDGISGDEQAIDDSPQVVDYRLETLREELRKDDHEGLILAHPCQRGADLPHFLHFVAAVEPQDPSAELTVMDPSELIDFQTKQRVGGVFQRSEEEVRKMLTPLPDHFIPVFAYIVKMDILPVPEFAPLSASAEVERGSGRSGPGISADAMHTDRFAIPVAA